MNNQQYNPLHEEQLQADARRKKNESPLAGKWMVNGVLQELTEDQVIQYATNWLQESSPTYVWKEGVEVLKPTRKLDVELIHAQAARIRDLEAEIERLKIALELAQQEVKEWSDSDVRNGHDT